MLHAVRDFDHLRSGLPGLSARLLVEHLDLYAAFIGKVNEIEARLGLSKRTAASATYNDYSELKRREAVALNGAYLHGLYFEALAPRPLPEGSPLRVAIDKAFGSVEAWRRDFRAAATSTHGWVVLTHSRVDGLLHHYVLSGHHVGMPVHQAVILAVDCQEHAYALDYGLAKQDYLSAAMENLDWRRAELRYAEALALPVLAL